MMCPKHLNEDSYLYVYYGLYVYSFREKFPPVRLFPPVLLFRALEYIEYISVPYLFFSSEIGANKISNMVSSVSFEIRFT